MNWPATMLVIALIARGVRADDPPTPQPTPETLPEKAPEKTPEPVPETKPAPRQSPPASDPTLDELLGIPVAKPAAQPADAQPAPAIKPAAPDPHASDLTRRLHGQESNDDFAEAVHLMGESSKRLSARDAGVDTQRMQQETLLRLDKLIDAAEKQRSKSQKSSQQKQQDQDRQAQQQQSRPKSQQNQNQQNAANATGGNPAGPNAPGAPPRAGDEAKWGNLPQHIRDALQQGFADRFSSTYRRKTEEYYKRLAEERGTARGGNR